MPHDFNGEASFQQMVWTLVDADGIAGHIPERFFTRETRLFTIFTTSPRQTRWKQMPKNTSLEVIIMNPWTRKEISRV